LELEGKPKELHLPESVPGYKYIIAHTVFRGRNRGPTIDEPWRGSGEMICCFPHCGFLS
jgi:hypothetical protein